MGPRTAPASAVSKGIASPASDAQEGETPVESRRERLDRLSERIRAGNYHVQPEELAHKLMETMERRGRRGGAAKG